MNIGKTGSSSPRPVASRTIGPGDSTTESSEIDGPVVAFHFSDEVFDLPSMGLAPLENWQPAQGFGAGLVEPLVLEMNEDHFHEMVDMLPLLDLVRLSLTSLAVHNRLRATANHSPDNFRARYVQLVHLVRQPWSPDAPDAAQRRLSKIEKMERHFQSSGNTDFADLLTSLKGLVLQVEGKGLDEAGRQALLEFLESAAGLIAQDDVVFLYRAIAAMDLSQNRGMREVDDLIARINRDPVDLEPLLRNGFMRDTLAALAQVSVWMRNPAKANLRDLMKLWHDNGLPTRELQWCDGLQLQQLRRLKKAILGLARPTFELPPAPEPAKTKSLFGNCAVS